MKIKITYGDIVYVHKSLINSFVTSLRERKSTTVTVSIPVKGPFTPRCESDVARKWVEESSIKGSFTVNVSIKTVVTLAIFLLLKTIESLQNGVATPFASNFNVLNNANG